MNASKVLFVSQFGPGEEKDQRPCDQFFAYQYANKFQRIKKRLFLKAGLTDRVFDEEFESVNLQQYELIVVQEMFSWNPLYVLRFLRTQNKTCKLFYWLRNTLFIEKYGTGITPQNIKNFLDAQEQLDFRILSFDREDCIKYGLQYAVQCVPQVNWDDIDLSDTTCEWDVSWVGKDKGRLDTLLQIKRQCEDRNLKTNFQILPIKRKTYSPEVKPMLLRRSIPYEDVLKIDAKSRAILDIVQNGQGGLTYRPLESINLRRKLITTFKNIRSYDFYQKENIFILGEDQITDLPLFLRAPYKEIPEEILKNYTFEGMLREVYRENHWDFSKLE